mmetsp:Transcript_12879/g.54110  ORF Transcript_12879/g.54110 Transcript_12879/m.54110 type:complete len:114 (-) Transcript_12879:147-488(-)
MSGPQQQPSRRPLRVILGADGPPVTTAAKRAGASVTAAACLAFALVGAAFPMWYARHATPTDMSKELSNQQISRRGPYLNSGSNDIGPTPDGFATSARARRTAQTRQSGSAEN